MINGCAPEKHFACRQKACGRHVSAHFPSADSEQGVEFRVGGEAASAEDKCRVGEEAGATGGIERGEKKGGRSSQRKRAGQQEGCEPRSVGMAGQAEGVQRGHAGLVEEAQFIDEPEGMRDGVRTGIASSEDGDAEIDTVLERAGVAVEDDLRHCR